MRQINFKRLYLCHFCTKSNVWPLVWINSMRRKVHQINFKRLYLCYFFTKSNVWPLVWIDSMRRKVRQINFKRLYMCYFFTNPMFDHLFESSRWDDSNKWSNIGSGEEIVIIETKICTLSGALKLHIFVSIMTISSPDPMFDHLLESSHWDDSNKWSNIGIGEAIKQVELLS